MRLSVSAVQKIITESNAVGFGQPLNAIQAIYIYYLRAKQRQWGYF